MQLTLTKSAASILYSTITYFFFILSMLGLAELLFGQLELMKVITPLTTLHSAIAFLVLIYLKKITPNATTKKFCLPLILISFFCFLFFEFAFLFHMQVDVNLGWISRNPFTLSLSPIFMFAIFSAFLIKSRYENVESISFQHIKIAAFIVVLIGTSIWHQDSLNLVKDEEINAREKVHLIHTMLNKTLNNQKNILTRIKDRAENLSPDDFANLVKVDAKNLTNDYDVMKGVLVVDNELEYVFGNDFAQKYYTSGKLEKPSIKAWLTQNKNEIQFAANSLTLDSQTPILMFLATVNLEDNLHFYILTLVDMNLLLEKSYLKYFSKYDTYIELAPSIYFAVDRKNEKITSLEELKANYNNFITESINVMDLVEHKIYSFISDYDDIHYHTMIEQLTFLLTFIFVFILILIADASRISAFRAKHEELTGLLRLGALNEEFLKIKSKKDFHNFSTAIIKLDFFESIHNSLGHEISDDLLKAVADRVKLQVENMALVSKGVNDNFILYFIGIPKSELEQKINHLLIELSKPYHIGKLELNLTASCGTVNYKQLDAFDIKLNLQQANIALERAKFLGGNQVEFYQSYMEDTHKEIIEIRNNLYKALQNNELEVYYQPIHCLDDNTLIGVEALVRWSHEGKWISPAKFIPIAETTEQVVQVGEQVLEKVMGDIKKYPQLQKVVVAVNFSTKQIVKSDFSNNLNDLLLKNDITYNHFTVEVTESSFQEKAQIENTLHALIKLGVNVAIDDFGTGYSSLSSLANQPANIIKIDREFTMGAEVESKEQRLLDTIISACFDLGKRVVVEGVEDEKLIQYLSKYKNIRIQGYFFSKPLPIEQLLDYMDKNETPR